MYNIGARLLRSLAGRHRSLLAVLCLVSAAHPAFAEDEDLRSIEVFSGSSAEIVSVGRSPRPASQTAENITVINSPEIASLNAHTLADILANIPGIQLEMTRTPGTFVNLDIQGSRFNHVLVLIDDVPINTLGENISDINKISAQLIERVEIVKGAASTVWGNALGGVVNVITKTPEPERRFSGMVSGSLGDKNTADTRAEVSGTVNSTGYYLAGGKLRSDGLRQNNMSDKNTVYGKIHYQLPTHGSLTFSTFYNYGSSGLVGFSGFKQNQEGHLLISNLALQYPITDYLLLDASTRVRSNYDFLTVTASPPTRDNETSTGGTLKVSWVTELQRIVAGVDYDHEHMHLIAPLGRRQPGVSDLAAERVGVYFTDTFTFGAFAVTPSARYDSPGTGDHLFSPSLGITYALTDNTVLRGYTARGYSLTSLSRPNSTEKVWTSQLGAESGDIPYLWLKGTLFRNDTWNIAQSGEDFSIKGQQLKEGAEVEARTLPVYNTSLSVGYTYTHATHPEAGSAPRHTLDLGVKYQDRKGLRALLTGRYLDWNDQSQGGKYGAMIWDLHLGKTFEVSERVSLEVFGSVWNLFNGSQFLNGAFENPGRWGEVGVRCNF